METVTKNKPKAFSLFDSMTNPLIRKLNKVEETGEASMTLNGVARKSLFFLASIIVGVVLAFVLNQIGAINVVSEGEEISVSPAALIALCVAGLFFILTPILAFLIRATIPVTGTLYCFSTGYIFSFIGMLLPEYRGIINLALVLTVAVVAVLCFLYSRRIVQVTKKLRTIVITLMGAMIAASVLTLIASFIPALKDSVRIITQNPLISIGASAVYVVIAALFLLVDFDAIERAIQNNVDRKYEWLGAFSVTFSVIWLFLKILSLISSIKDSSSK